MQQETKAPPAKAPLLCPACVKKLCIIFLAIACLIGYQFSPLWQDRINSAIVLLDSPYPELLIEFLYSLEVNVWIGSILLTLFQSVIFPVSVISLIKANMILFGELAGILLSYVAIMLGASLNFWIAKILAKGLEKFVSETTITTLKQRVQPYEMPIIALLRLLPLPCFDVVSYLAGVSSCSFVKYLIGTAIGMIPALGFYAYFDSQEALLEWGFWAFCILIAIMGGYMIYKKSASNQTL